MNPTVLLVDTRGPQPEDDSTIRIHQHVILGRIILSITSGRWHHALTGFSPQPCSLPHVKGLLGAVEILEQALCQSGSTRDASAWIPAETD